MLALSLFTSLQTLLSAESTQAQIEPLASPESGVLETSPRSFQEEVPLGNVSSYTLSFKEGDAVVGTATLVEVDEAATNLYLQTNRPLLEVALHFGTCDNLSQDEDAFIFEPPADDTTPIILDQSLEEILHPRVPHVLIVDDTVTTHCVEL